MRMELIDKNALNFTDFEIAMCGGDFAKAFKLICEKLDDAPIIEAEPVRRGKWEIIDDTEFRVPGWYCSLCNYQISDRYGKYNYCPHCGAKMEV